MKRLVLTIAVAVFTLIASVGLADASATWSNAQNINVFSSLGGSGGSVGSLITCTTPGNCIVLGTAYSNSVAQGFQVSESNNVWGAATTVPGLDALAPNATSPDFQAIGCSSQATCVAAGTYSAGQGLEGFLYEVNMAAAIAIPGLSSLNAGGNVMVKSVSCSSSGNCTIVGFYTDGATRERPFTVDQVDGAWQNASPVTNTPDGGQLLSVSCWAHGECVAVGYRYNNSVYEAITLRRTNGVWGSAELVPGVATFGSGSEVSQVSCSPDGACTATGLGNFIQHVIFTSSLVNNTWTTAAPLSGISALDTSGLAKVNNLSCWTAADCLAVGEFEGPQVTGSWVAQKTNGEWGTAVSVPGSSALTTAEVYTKSLSCAPDGTCALIGNFNLNSVWQAYVMMRNANGTLSDATLLPGLPALNVGGYADPKAMSCVIGGCATTGFFLATQIDSSTFVADMTYTPEPTPSPTPTPDPIAPAFTG